MTESPSLIGQPIAQYRVLEKIGAGGMGVVYLAHDTRLERDVALKVLPAGALADSATRKRFRNEALALARLNHPNICSVFDFNSEESSDFLVMEFVPGTSLNDRLKEKSSLLEEVPRIGQQLAMGLASAHEQGVVHRDLKPGNLRVTPDGRLKILDFGLATFFRPEAGPEGTLSAADTSAISGTIPYMAPEQLRGEPADTRTDIYSAGVVLFELATGRRPFPERQLARLIDDILNTDAPPASRINRNVTPALDGVLRKALAHRPEDRYQSARELQADMERLSDPQAGPAPAKRGLHRLAAVATLGLLVIGATIGWYFSRKREQNSSYDKPATYTDAGFVRPARISARRSVAVFAIKNVSGRADSAWLSTALSEMLTTELAAGERLRTIPGESVARAKVDLSLSDNDEFAQDTLRRISARIGTDAVVNGSYVVVPGGREERIRVDLRVQDSHTGEILSAVSETGTQAELLEIVSRAGAKLRSSLGVLELSVDEAGKVRGSLPTSPDAARLYAEGLDKLRVLDAVAAKALFEKAVAADPSNSAIHSALSAAWAELGYDARALEESKKAVDLSAGLPREQRLVVEGRYQHTAHDWPKMLEIYKTLFHDFPDNPEYGLQLASAESYTGKTQEAFATLEKLRTSLPSLKDDPAIDLMETSVAENAGDYKHELDAANRAVGHAKSRGERLTAASGLLSAGWASSNLGDVEKATAASTEAKAAYEDAGDRVGVSKALHNLALIFLNQGKLDQAESYFNQTITIRRQIQDNRGLARALGDLGFVYEKRGDLPAARKSFEQSLVLARQTSDANGVAGAYTNLSDIDTRQGKLSEGRKDLEQALAIFRQLGSKNGIAVCLANLGNFAAMSGDDAGARKLFDEAATTFAAVGQKANSAQMRMQIADLESTRGDYVSAGANYVEALKSAYEVGDPSLIADGESGSSKVAYQQGDWQAARSHSEKALAAAKAAGDKRLLALVQYDFASSLDGDGDIATSKKAIQDGLALARELGDKEVIAIGLFDAADYLLDQGDLTAAQQSWEQVLDLDKQLKAVENVAETQVALAGVLLELHQTARAMQLATESANEMRRVKNARMEIDAQIVLARAALAQNHVPAAKEALARTTTLSSGLGPASPSRQLRLAVWTARVHAAESNSAAALQTLQTALNDLGPRTTLQARFEARLAVAELTLASSGAAAARPLLDVIEKDATEKSYGLFARKAAALRKP